MKWALAVGWALWAAPAPAPVPWMKLSDPERAAAIAALSDKPLADRVVLASERFMGTRYLFSPLGEGQGKDPDPLIRFDAADCLSLVEETMALSIAPRPDAVEGVLTRIRYQSEPTYDDRNHLMEAQWIPNNIAKGFIQDVTRQYGGRDTTDAAKTYTPASWTSRSGQGLGLPPDKQVIGTFHLSMIPLRRFVEKARSVPSGTIVVVVRRDQSDVITRVSHLGLLVQRPQGPFLRHASSVGKREVIDERLDAFVARHARFAAWPVEGFALYAVQSPPFNAGRTLDGGLGI